VAGRGPWPGSGDRPDDTGVSRAGAADRDHGQAVQAADDLPVAYRQVNQPGAGGAVYAVGHGDQFVYVYQGRAPYRVAACELAVVPPPSSLVAVAPSWLLAARHQVVPFTGRTGERDDLAGWRDGEAAAVAVRLVHGPGGQGKTRLAARFAQESAAAGWTAVTALHHSDPAAVFGREAGGSGKVRVDGQGLLLVVDYAERWPVGDLLALIGDHQRAGGGRVRVLLLARPAGTWWAGLAYRLARAGITDVDHLPLQALAAGPQGRAGLFTAAAAAFAAHRRGGPRGGAPPPRVDPPPDLERADAYGLVLTVHMAALAAVDAYRRGQVPPADAAGLSGYLLDRERDHWTVLHATGRVTTSPTVMGHTVYTATLTRAVGHEDGVAALGRTGVAADPASAAGTLADHGVAYPPAQAGTALEPLYPDRLAEDFLALTTPGHTCAHPTEAWAATAAARLLSPAPDASVPSWTKAGLGILIETATRWPHIATGVLYPLLAAHPELAVAAGGAALTRLVDLPGLDLALLETITPHLPEGRHVDLDPAAAAITARLHAHRLAAATDDAERARLHATLGYRLGNASRPEEALAATSQAVDLYRRLAATRPDAFEPDLATALNNLGNRLSDLGRREEALAATSQAVEIRRRLAATRPDAFEPDLAMALNNLGAMLSGLGRWEEALAATSQAVDLYRRLAATRPDAFEPDLALALNNLGRDLSGLGRREEALAATSQAVDLYRRLAAARPDAFEPDLAMALNNLGIRLSDLGRREEALAATSHAVEIRRRLAAARPDAFEPDLARSLWTFAWVRAAVQAELPQALASAEEAVTHYEALATRTPLAFVDDLAGALTTLADVLDGLDRAEDAAAARRRAADLGSA
jgi:tetratricopeptide (TPR) repeat protein